MRCPSIPAATLMASISLTAVLLSTGCSEQPGAPATGVAVSTPDRPPAVAPAPVVQASGVEIGVFPVPELKLREFMLHNEYDDDGDGDGRNETHVRRYINKQGDTAFSMTTADRLWAWSLDTKSGDNSDIQNNFVIRDSNCDGVFDERYRMDAEFRVPACLAHEGV